VDVDQRARPDAVRGGDHAAGAVSLTRHSEFMMETRPYGGGFTNFVGIKCGWCKVEEWHPARNGGWAMRIFRVNGWKVGSKDNQHRCPVCFGRVLNARRTPDNPAIPKEIGKALKAKLKETHVRDALLGTSVLVRHPEKPGREPVPLPQPIVAAGPSTPPTPLPEPATAHPKPVRGRHSVPGVTMFTRRDNAARAATNRTGSVDGIEFFTLPLGEGWTWKHAADVTEEERVIWRESRTYGPVPKQSSLARMAATKKEETPVNAIAPIEKDPMPPTPEALTAAPSPVADPIPQPTRDERQLIHDELTKHYNIVDQRYDGSDSDTNVGGRLNMPRAWVTSVREMFFGEYDRNASSEKKKLALTEAVALAGAATKRLLEMAAEAETIERGLVDALNKMEG
jgi:hypothetical protein